MDGYILVHASVNGQPVTLILDSGASASVLSLDAAKRLGLRWGLPSWWKESMRTATAFEIEPVTPRRGRDFAWGGLRSPSDLRNAAKLCSEPSMD